MGPIARGETTAESKPNQKRISPGIGERKKMEL